MQTLHIIKIGGSIVNDEAKLRHFLQKFVQLKQPKLIVHGGGNSASNLCSRLNIPVKMDNGRRITDKATLDVAVMVYAGLINKSIVAKLQGHSCNSLGLSGADLNMIPAQKREGGDIDFGFVGDIDPADINAPLLRKLIDEQIVPVFSAVTHDEKGQLFNTNADSIASSLATALSDFYNVTLTYCFERPGVLLDVDDDDSLIDQLSQEEFVDLQQSNVIHDGMIPKVSTGFEALHKNVSEVHIKQADNLLNDIGTELRI